MIIGPECYITAIRPFVDGHVPDGLDDAADFDLFIVTSSAEIDIVHEPRAREIIQACTPRGYAGEISFVSIGCAGLFASVIEFVQRPMLRCRILALETPASFVQHTLDISNLGPGGDGFIAQDTACVVDLSKLRDGALAKIGHCEILARRNSFGGTADLSRQVVRCLVDLCERLPGAEIVTFENASLWSRRLLQLVKAMLGDNAVLSPERWLSTIECDERHFMTVRPLMDMLTHLHETRSQPLIVTCLGAGGRVGVIALERLCDAPPAFESTFGRGDPHHLGVIVLAEYSVETIPLRPTRLRYTDHEFYGRNNFYFQWTLRN